MESETPKLETQVAEKKETANINTAAAGDLVPVGQDKAQWQEAIEPINDFINTFPQTFTEFFSNYKNLVSVLGYGTLAIVSVYLTLAVLDAINDIPLLAPLFELVGLGYTGWFVARYLWRRSTRQELWAELASIKENIIGPEKSEEK
ncbi:MAG: CAAD domain-containing protein [Prochloraceae cyanobacterium]|nr:CAAD domain-containing protein [Prochloraceae cyanobacterium]